ncbi:hypothetical protein PoB_000823000 [Plakobranchus ocellatus]|uniref:Uncharacterized protein n=1 Tax=Plakobranchus ocellatus TaxID=259542 RepID=A0AAV3YF82_9GAST|nr:hypothetical protein PoB_000823000 [Plakobranchus ocellatus]
MTPPQGRNCDCALDRVTSGQLVRPCGGGGGRGDGGGGRGDGGGIYDNRKYRTALYIIDSYESQDISVILMWLKVFPQ